MEMESWEPVKHLMKNIDGTVLNLFGSSISHEVTCCKVRWSNDLLLHLPISAVAVASTAASTATN